MSENKCKWYEFVCPICKWEPPEGNYKQNGNKYPIYKNQALPIIGYIEKEGLIEELLATAREVLK